MRIAGQIQHGVYGDDWSDVPEDELTQQLGAHGADDMAGSAQVQRDEVSDTGSGSSDSSDQGIRRAGSTDSFSTLSFIRRRVQKEILHRPVPVKRIQEPFGEQTQRELITRIVQSEVPQGFGLLDSEGALNNYQPFQFVRVGRSNRNVKVTLPLGVWMPRTRLWVRAVWEMTRMKDELGFAS